MTLRLARQDAEWEIHKWGALATSQHHDDMIKALRELALVAYLSGIHRGLQQDAPNPGADAMVFEGLWRGELS